MKMAEIETVAKNFKEFAYAVSHDLGTPLRAMVEFSRILKAENLDALDDDSKLYLSMIINNGEKAQAMLAGLLEYSRLNTVVMPFAPTDCNQLIGQCQSELAETIAKHKAKIAAGALPTVHADSDQIKRLLLALLRNAVLFHPAGKVPDVSVSAEQHANEWVFTVRDNGIGIDPKFHERIFLPFRRLHPEEEYPGVGMGLALAKKIVEHHGGRIWVDSEPGRGAAFLFSLPAGVHA